jgi:hypothetical protein
MRKRFLVLKGHIRIRTLEYTTTHTHTHTHTCTCLLAHSRASKCFTLVYADTEKIIHKAATTTTCDQSPDAPYMATSFRHPTHKMRRLALTEGTDIVVMLFAPKTLTASGKKRAAYVALAWPIGDRVLEQASLGAVALIAAGHHVDVPPEGVAVLGLNLFRGDDLLDLQLHLPVGDAHHIAALPAEGPHRRQEVAAHLRQSRAVAGRRECEAPYLNGKGQVFGF